MHAIVLLTVLAAAPAPARLELVAADPKDGKFEEVKGDDAKGPKVIARAPWRFGVQDGSRHQHVIRSQEELKAAGAQAEQLLKALKVDQIDWKTQMVILVSGGAQRTGGYSVEVTKLDVRDKTLTVHWKLNTPKPGQPVTQAFTHPAQTLLVERFDGTVKFDPPAGKEDK